MTQPFSVRDARPEDLPDILAIYNDAVAHSTAIWNEVPVDLDNRRNWFEMRRQRAFPILVAEGQGGRVLGYASYGDWRPFDGFRHSVEHSVYIAAESRGMGLGRVLMQALIERARGGGVHVMVGAIEAGNTASIRLHESLGFRLVGVHREVGIKFGRWLDLAMMELRTGA